MIRWNRLWRIVPLFTVLTFVLTGCGMENLSVLTPKGPVAEKQLFLIYISLVIMIVVLIVVFVIYAYVLIKYRSRPGNDALPKQVEGNHKLEIIWTVIPFLLLIVLAVPTIKYTFELDRDYSNDPEALQVRVTAHQFWWEFEYLDEKITTAQDLVIPTGRTISFHLETADVLHSFWVPALGGKKDNVNGVTNMHSLVADAPGIYYGKCAELCGTSHALMDFKVDARTPEEYALWAQQMMSPPAEAASIPAAVADGEIIFKQSCIGCHAVYDRETKAIAGGKSGPSLVNYANRTTVAGILYNTEPGDVAKNTEAWMKDPQKIKPGNLMPNPQKLVNSSMEYDLGLTDPQVDALVQYLSTLKQQ